MAFNPIGTVLSLTGEASALDDKGIRRPLKPGDPVYSNEIIRTAEESLIEIRFIDGSLKDLGSQSEMTLDNQVLNSASTTLSDQSDIEALQAAIEAGKDPTEVTRAPAAGQAEDDGSDIVQIEYNDPRATPESGFDTRGIAVQFTEPVEDLLLDPEAATASLSSQAFPPSVFVPQDTTTFNLNGTVVHGEGSLAEETDFIFSVNRSGNVSQAGSVDYRITGGPLGTANSEDFADPDLLNDAFTLNFGAGETEKQITIAVSGDISGEEIESFTVNLSNPIGTTDTVLVDNDNDSATGVILDDDTESNDKFLTITPDDVLSDPNVILGIGMADAITDPRVQLIDIPNDDINWQNDPTGQNPTDFAYSPITVEIGPEVIVDIV